MSLSVDFYLKLIQSFKAKGLTDGEILQEFNRDDFNKTLRESIEEGEDRLLDFAANAGRDNRNIEDLNKAIELWTAGWKSEIPKEFKNLDVMSWYWRRPPIGNRKTGKLFLSTDQAYSALKKLNF